MTAPTVSPSSTLQFLGAAGTVTGSRHLISHRERTVLLDCGMFQGLKDLRQRNWARFPIAPEALDAVVLSHAHIDHCGYLPVLARYGYTGPIYCTPATASLLPIMLMDSAEIQQEDAERANRKGYSRHHPALPLYTTDDVRRTLKLVEARPYHTPFAVTENVQAILRRTGHILGSASIELLLGPDDPYRCVFSGDLGRWDRPILRDPEFVPEADTLLVESTYGNKVHPPDPLSELAQVVHEAADRGGTLIVPAFALGRTQELIWNLRQLEADGRIPAIPVIVDSPMAIEVTDHYCSHPEEHDLEMAALMSQESCPLRAHSQHWVRTRDDSKKLNQRKGAQIIIAASGMATGGRVLHHLAQRLPDPKTTVLLVGFQAAGTRGRDLLEGRKRIRIHGRDIAVNAQIRKINGLSAHADRDEILRWLRGFTRPPKTCYLVHGEPEPASALAETIRTQLGWNAQVAIDAATVPLIK